MAIKAGWEPEGAESSGHPGHRHRATSQRGLATATDDQLSVTLVEGHPAPVLTWRRGCSAGQGAVAGRAAGVTIPLPSCACSQGIPPAHQRVTLVKNTLRAVHGWACCIILRVS